MWTYHIHPRSQTGKKKKKKNQTHIHNFSVSEIQMQVHAIYILIHRYRWKLRVPCYAISVFHPSTQAGTCLLPFFTTVLKDKVREVTMVTIVTFTSAYHWANWMVCSTQISTAGKLPNLVAADLHSCPWTQTHHPQQVLILKVLA
jgi:hypothetical protein